jgi:hypothetical protein
LHGQRRQPPIAGQQASGTPTGEDDNLSDLQLLDPTCAIRMLLVSSPWRTYSLLLCV